MGRQNPDLPGDLILIIMSGQEYDLAQTGSFRGTCFEKYRTLDELLIGKLLAHDRLDRCYTLQGQEKQVGTARGYQLGSL